VVLRGVEHSSSSVRRSAIAASLRLAQDGILTSQQVVAIIAARLDDIIGSVRRASVAALGHLGEHAATYAAAKLVHDQRRIRIAALQVLGALKAFAAPHVAAVAAVAGWRVSNMDARVQIAGLKALGSLATCVPAVMEYVSIIERCQNDIYVGTTADAVIRTFERAGLWQRPTLNVDVYGNQGSADCDVLRLWMHGHWGGALAISESEGCPDLTSRWDPDDEWYEGIEWQGVTFGDDAVTARRVVTIRLGSETLSTHTLPVQLGELDALRELDICDNLLQSIPSTLGALSSLKVLRLAKNVLQHVPAELGQLLALTTLDLSNNELFTVPAELGLLTALQVLRLEWNSLTHIPAELGSLASLRELDINGNLDLKSVPAELGLLTALKVLHYDEWNLLTHPTEWKEGGALELSGCDIEREEDKY